MGENSTKYVANLIIQIANENNIKMNNMKLNGVLAYLYYDTENNLEIDEPCKKGHFYKIESIYERFNYYGAEEIKSVPSDFNFLILLEDNHEETIKQKYTKSRRISYETINKMKAIENEYGSYIENIIIELSDIDIFKLNKKIKNTFLNS